ncbi:MCE family protein [Mycobacterium sp. EPa45]|uniref:MCE family protein n=1 Tax=Mycobacterium sp. EPa45 TaxID=1545728 RepID=UPI0006427239|nr:MCE family protein [Mycobacterium sp. EPa45]AKK29535.1 mammalian cell entry protein [Mycobacterium sp. EPa45]
MTGRLPILLSACAVTVATAGCSFHGVNSLPLPGTVGHGPGSVTYHVELADVGTLESNSPVMLGDVVVGSVGKMSVDGWHANVEVSVKPGVVIPANAVATVGQTSLLGSMHLALDPLPGQPAQGHLSPGTTIRLNSSSTYPSTEQTLSALSALINGGGVTQIGDVIHNASAMLSGHEDRVRDLLNRLNDVAGMLADQRDSVVDTLDQIDRLSTTLASRTDVIDRALREIPPALDVLIKERPRITEALDRLHIFSDTATDLIHDTQDDLVRNLRNLEPTVKAIADIGPDLDKVLAYTTTFPFTQSVIDRGVRGDYLNLYIVMDLTIPRLKRTMFRGTRWGDVNAALVPAPGDPWNLNYTYQPLSVGVTPPPPADPAPPTGTVDPQTAQMPTVSEPVVPVTPPLMPGTAASAPPTPGQLFAGPYPGNPASASPTGGP